MSHAKIVIRPLSAAILGAFLAGGLIGGAGTLGHYALKSVKTSKNLNRCVSARGLSERDVDADLAIWPLGFKVAANSLQELQGKIAKCHESVSKFLQARGFDPAEISTIPPKIRDFDAEGYSDANKRPYRYTGESAVILRSAKTSQVVEAMGKADSLISEGVPLIHDYESKAKFLFTGLKAIKPAMIEEANKDARKAAEKFAKDSGCEVGRILRASQGFFEIDERDPQAPQRKTARVVTSVEFQLE